MSEQDQIRDLGRRVARLERSLMLAVLLLGKEALEHVSLEELGVVSLALGQNLEAMKAEIDA